MSFRNLQLRFASRIVVAFGVSVVLSSDLQAGVFPLGRSEIPVVLPHSYYGKDSSGGELSAVFDARQSSGRIALRSDDASVEIITSRFDQRVILSRRDQKFQYTFAFVKSKSSQRFDLVELKRRSLEKLFYSMPSVDDSGSFDTSEVASSAFVKLNGCPSSSEMSASAQIMSLRDKVISQESCRDYKQDLKTLTEMYSPENSVRKDSPIACIESLGAENGSGRKLGSYVAMATDIRGRLSVTDSLKVRCEAGVNSNFDERSRTLTLGREILADDPVARKRVFLHEALHSYGIQDESEANAIADCCAEPNSSASRCELAQLFESLNFFKINGLKAAGRDDWLLVEELLRSKILNDAEKVSAVRELQQKYDKFANASSGSREKMKHGENLLQLAAKICEQIKTAECEVKQAAFKNKIEVQLGFLRETKNHVDRISKKATSDMATAPANPNADSQASPQQTAPQALQYRAETTEPAAVRREVERIRQPLMAAREYGGSVARTIVSSMGNTAYAANSSLPRRVSKTEWTSAVKSVDPKTGRVTLDLGRDERGRQIVASASIPFDGSQFGPPQVSVQAEKLPAISDRTTVNRKLNASASPRVDLSESTYKSATEVGSSIPGRLPRGAGTAKAQGAKAVESEGALGSAGASGSNLSSGGSSGASRSSSPSRSIADAPSVSASVLKRMLVRTESPDAIIRDHIEDLKANSMQVRYKCVWYPQNFKGTQLFDLDAYQGRKCGPQ